MCIKLNVTPSGEFWLLLFSSKSGRPSKHWDSFNQKIVIRCRLQNCNICDHKSHTTTVWRPYFTNYMLHTFQLFINERETWNVRHFPYFWKSLTYVKVWICQKSHMRGLTVVSDVTWLLLVLKRAQSSILTTHKTCRYTQHLEETTTNIFLLDTTPIRG